MNYAFMTFSCPDLDFDAVLQTAVRYGYDGIEPRLSSGHAHGIEFDMGADARSRVREQAHAAGVAICCIATSCRFADPSTAAEAIADAHRAIDLAGDLDAPCIRVFGGAIPEGLTREAAVAQVAGALDALKTHAAERQVRVCMETHDHWCDPADVVAVMQAVNHPAVRVNWDIMHPVLTSGWSIDAAYDALRPWIAHAHVHDGRRDNDKRTLAPIGTGMVDHRRAIARLLADGYKGYLSGEWIRWKPADAHLPQELKTLKSLEREALHDTP